MSITLGLLVPYAAPDMMWSAGRAVHRDRPLYVRPVEALQRFVDTGASGSSGRFKYQQSYGTVLEHLDAHYALRHIARADRGLRFRLLLADRDIVGID